jgi:ribose 5-phosphate isomerase B
MHIGIAGDHNSIKHKDAILDYLKKLNHDVYDYGTYSTESCDYPDYAKKLCTSIINLEVECGILVCGSGIGMSIVANKFSGIRCALTNDIVSAQLAKEHNNAQVIALGSKIVNIDVAISIVDIWLTSKFDSRHQSRIDKIEL